MLLSGAEDIDDAEGWVDEVAAMMAEERAEFESKVCLVRMVLTKVSTLPPPPSTEH